MKPHPKHTRSPCRKHDTEKSTIRKENFVSHSRANRAGVPQVRSAASRVSVPSRLNQPLRPAGSGTHCNLTVSFSPLEKGRSGCQAQNKKKCQGDSGHPGLSAHCGQSGTPRSPRTSSRNLAEGEVGMLDGSSWDALEALLGLRSRRRAGVLLT